jgi:hypothetical protein
MSFCCLHASILACQLNPASPELVEAYEAALGEQARTRAQVQGLLQAQRDALIQQRLQLHYLQEQQRRLRRHHQRHIRQQR